MGEHNVTGTDKEELREFMRSLLEDVRALERMIETGKIETGVRRIGAEQEMFLVDGTFEPAPVATQLLEALGRPEYTLELARFNFEANLTPREFRGDALSSMEKELDSVLSLARAAAEALRAKIVLCGILPTLHLADLTLENMVPRERFHILNKVMRDLRGGDFHTLIKGLDELQILHDNVMLEACTTSFQLHFQVGPDEFARLYNLAQAITGPVLAVGVNSPLLLQHRLWHETRVALFQQSLDVRSRAFLQRGKRQRVNFGEHWVERSVLEIFREDVARYRVLLASGSAESPMEVLDKGGTPALRALCLHNGTVYRWNRPCYGIKDGKAHLRIENRVLPAGPTVIDEMANAAFYVGLMAAADSDELADIAKVMDFDDARGNFVAAARYGLNAQFRWTRGRSVPARELVLGHLLPLAREGLRWREIDAADVERYLGIVEERVRSGRTGAQWALDSLAQMPRGANVDSRHRAIVSGIAKRQFSVGPVHTWSLVRLGEDDDWRHSFRTIDQVMTRDVFTVHPEDVIDLAASLMEWKHVHRVPVEDDEGHLVGLLSQRDLLGLVAEGTPRTARPVAVREIMKPDPITVTPQTTTLEAIELLRRHECGCLPVVEGGKLVGIVTEHDFIAIATKLLEEGLREER